MKSLSIHYHFNEVFIHAVLSLHGSNILIRHSIQLKIFSMNKLSSVHVSCELLKNALSGCKRVILYRSF